MSLDELSTLCSSLKVYKRIALNVKEQLETIDESMTDTDYDLAPRMEGIITNLCSELKARAGVTPVQSYLHHAEIGKIIDSASEGIWDIVKESPEEFLREQISSQREVYDAERKTDNIGLRRLLRDILRDDDAFEFMKSCPAFEIRAVINAIKLHITIISGSDNRTFQLCESRITQLETTLSSMTRAVPKSSDLTDFTGKINHISNSPVIGGAFCLIWSGDLYGKKVAIYSPTQNMNHNHSVVLKESIAWSTFDHPHILPFLGVVHDFLGIGVALLSPWIENSTVKGYLRNNPNVDRLKIVSDLADAVAYLHTRNPPYIHSLLTTSSVLIDDQGDVILSSFAWNAFDFQDGSAPAGSLRWIAPELASRTTPSVANTASDIYGFAMTALEILTGVVPFQGLRAMRVLETIAEGGRPSRPSGDAAAHGLDDALWDLLQRCWAHEPHSRPPATVVHEELLKIRKFPAIHVPDLSAMITLEGDVHIVVASGGFGDIRRGIMKTGEYVALKTLSVRGANQTVLRLTRRFRREGSLWSRLNHRNVLPFLGTADIPGLQTCMVAPLMRNGNCLDYFKQKPHAPCLPVVRGIIRGLEYLHQHQPPVIHGDLRGANVLISDEGEALLTDFGLAVIIEDLVKMPISSVLQDAGNPRWMAPELFIGDNFVSMESDVYAFAMVVLEVMTRDMPFAELKSYPQVILAIHSNIRPARPGPEAKGRGLTDKLWGLMQECWAQDPHDRPSTTEVQQRIHSTGSK